MPGQVPNIITSPTSTIEILIVRAVAVMDASDITLQVRVHSRTITKRRDGDGLDRLEVEDDGRGVDDGGVDRDEGDAEDVAE